MKTHLFLFVFLLFPGLLYGKPEFTILVNEFKPNVIVDESGGGTFFSGFEIDLIDHISKELDFNYQLKKADSVQGVIQGVNSGDGDIGLGAVSITSDRMNTVDFSYPYMDSGLKVLVLASDGGGTEIDIFERAFLVYYAILSSFFSVEFLTILYCYFVMITVSALTFQTLENSKEKNLNIWDSFYFCVVTSSTVGYGDLTAKTDLGKVFVLFQILLGVAFFANLTGHISAEYTMSNLKPKYENIGDLYNQRIAVKSGATSQKLVREYTPNVIYLNSHENLIDYLMKGKCDAVIVDQPYADYVSNLSNRIMALNEVYMPQKYGFVLKDKELKREINLAILRMVESGDYERIYNRWF